MGRVLLTGGAGYIGIHTAIQLIGTGKHQAVVVDYRIPDKLREAVTTLVPEGSIEWHEQDLAAADAVEALDKKVSTFDAVIHFAALKAVGESVEQPLRYYRNNLNSLMNVVRLCEKKGCSKFVFSSSATVYLPSENPLTEDSPLGASNPYGQTKVMGEQILTDYCKANPNFQVVSLRYFNPIGAHPSGKIGEAPDVPMNILPIIQKVALQQWKEVTVMGKDWPTPDGSGVRDYIHVMDLADGHILAMDWLNGQQHGVYETFNLGTGKGVSVFEMMSTFEKVNNVKVPHTVGPRRPGDLSTVVCDPSKAQKMLGFKATRTVEDACKSAWNWISKNPSGYN